MAKGITSAYVPLGAVGLQPQLARAFQERAFPGGLTYNSHPLACAAALATIRVYEEEGLRRRTPQRMGKVLRRAAAVAIEKKHPSVGATRSIGLFGMFELVRNRNSYEPMAPFNGTSDEMAALGRFFREKGLYTFVRWNTFFTNPPLIDHRGAAGRRPSDDRQGARDHRPGGEGLRGRSLIGASPHLVSGRRRWGRLEAERMATTVEAKNAAGRRSPRSGTGSAASARDGPVERWGDVFNPATGRSRPQRGRSRRRGRGRGGRRGRDRRPRPWREAVARARARGSCSRSASWSRSTSSELAEILTREHGKVAADALGEVKRGLEVVEFACGIAAAPEGRVLRERLDRRRQLLDPPAARRRRRHHAVQLPGDGADVDVPARDRVREHLRPEAVGEGSVGRQLLRASCWPRPGLPAGRLQRRPRRQGRGRRDPRRTPGSRR